MNFNLYKYVDQMNLLVVVTKQLTSGLQCTMITQQT